MSENKNKNSKSHELSDDTLKSAAGGYIQRGIDDDWYGVFDDTSGKFIGAYKKRSKAEKVANKYHTSAADKW